MTACEYSTERQRLQEVLKDAIDRGDYNLEMDVRDLLISLQERYNEEDTE